MKYLGVIPARGGSKGVFRKNIRDICGKPLIAWTIEAAQKSERLHHFIVSTDNAEIEEVSMQYGAEVLLRPPELATDTASTISVLQEVATQLPEFDAIVVLQPTSPVRDKGLIDECVQIFDQGRYTNLATGFTCKYQEFGSHNNLRRQDIEGFFYDDGNVYIIRRALVKQALWCGDNPYRHIIARHQNFEIDDELDFLILSTLIGEFKGV